MTGKALVTFGFFLSAYIGHAVTMYWNYAFIVRAQAETLAVKNMAEESYKRALKIENNLKLRVQSIARESVKMRKCAHILRSKKCPSTKL